MTIVKHTDTQLRLRFVPKLISMFGSLCTLILLPQFTKVLAPFAKAHILSCERFTVNEGSCKLIDSEFFKSDLRKISLAHLRKAQVIKVPVSKGKEQLTYQQIVLLTEKGGVPLHFVRTNQSNLKNTNLNAIALEINNFINDKQQKYLTVHQGIPFLDWVFAGIVLLNLLWLAASIEFVTWDFDKSRDLMTYKRQWLFFSTTVEHPIKDIVSIDLEEMLSRGLKAYRIKLLISKNQTLPLKICYGGYFLRQEHTEKMIETIANFVNKKTMLPYTN